jgi:hypothetical protein
MGTGHFKNLGTHGRIILKPILKYCGELCMETMWVKTGPVSGEIPSTIPEVWYVRKSLIFTLMESTIWK